MATKRVTDLTAITGANTATGDEFLIWDADASTHKKITRAELVEAMSAGGLAKSNAPTFTGLVTVFGAADALVIHQVIRNDQAGSGVAALGFNVASSAAAETSVSKAGIGLARSGAQGTGDLLFFNRATTDTSDFTSSDEKLRLTASGGNLLPGTTNAQDLGSASKEWQDQFLVNAATVSSGSAGKRNMRPASEAERRVAARLRARGCFYQLAASIARKGSEALEALDEAARANTSIEAEGARLARWHFGMLAEDVRADFAAEGLDAGRYGIFIANPETRRVEVKVKVLRPRLERRAVEELVETLQDDVVHITVEKVERDVPVLREVPVMMGGRQIGRKQLPVLDEVEASAWVEEETGGTKYALRYAQLEMFMAWAG